MLSYKLNLCNEATMVFSDHPAAFDAWKATKQQLRVLTRDDKPITTFKTFKEVFSDPTVLNTFKRQNAIQKNQFPWMPVGVMCQRGLADWHDMTDVYMIEKYRLTPQPITETRNTSTKKTREESVRVEHKGVHGIICNDRDRRKLHWLGTDYTKGSTFSTYNSSSPRHMSKDEADRYLTEFFRDTVNLTIALEGSVRSHEDIRRAAKALIAIAKESSRNTSRVRNLNEFI